MSERKKEFKPRNVQYKDCRLSDRKYQADHREEHRIACSEYYQKNKAQVLQRKKERYYELKRLKALKESLSEDSLTE